MSSKTTMQTPMTKSPCGCGGSGGASSSPCSCGGQGCQTCFSGSYIRPLFFAGQLLTEDDLQTLANYVAGKNRLHNRYLFGEGVACGLQVSCDPCHCGQVTVSPGYALDCCGNDIFVSCPQTLDINKMIRDLMTKMRGGVDCGDPCAGTSASAGKTTSQSPTATSVNSSSSGKGEANRHQHGRKYCLYINYCEQSSDPVTPYATDNPCNGKAICQATRVYEGFTFELRCPEKEECDPAICANFWNCVADQETAERQAADARFLQPYSSHLSRALREVRDELLPSPNLEALRLHTEELNARLDLLEKKPKETHPARQVAEAVLEPARKLAADLATLAAKQWGPEGSDDEERYKGIPPAVKALVRLESDSVRSALIAAYPESIERSYANAVVDVCARLHSEFSRSTERGEEPTFGLPPRPLRDLQILLLARGVVYTRRFQAEIARSLENMRGWLQLHVDLSPNSTIGLPVSKLNTMLVPPVIEQEDLSWAEIGITAEAARQLSCYVLSVLRDCFCNALLPPCAPCSDTGVLLACITVDDCCVKEICNLDRQFILSPVSLRYWIPEITQFGQAIEKWCCSKEECEETRTDDSAKPFSGILGLVPEDVELAIEAILRACPSPRKDAPPRISPLRFLSRAISEKLAEKRGARVEAESEFRPGTTNLEEEFQRLTTEFKTLKIEQGKFRAEIERLKKKPGN